MSGHTVSWIAADWGTSNLRIWLMAADGTVLERRDSTKGMGQLDRMQFEPALLDLISDVLTETTCLPVIVCGMAGARQGWVEAPYVAAPCPPPNASNATRVSDTDPRVAVHILPGVKQLAPEDVMRGEETQIAGFLAERPDFNGFLCLPGTHTKWARLESGQIEAFTTFMTGEVFNLLASQSVLRHGVTAGALDLDEFRKAVADIAKAPSALGSELFRIRAKGLLGNFSGERSFSRLSGLMVGLEISGMDLAGTDEISLLGSDRIAEAYRLALDVLGHKSRLVPAEDATLRGLQLAYSSLKEASK